MLGGVVDRSEDIERIDQGQDSRDRQERAGERRQGETVRHWIVAGHPRRIPFVPEACPLTPDRFQYFEPISNNRAEPFEDDRWPTSKTPDYPAGFSSARLPLYPPPRRWRARGCRSPLRLQGRVQVRRHGQASRNGMHCRAKSADG